MSGFDQRTAAFLQEMGIAPLWTLRGVEEASVVPEVHIAPVAEPAEAAPVAAAPIEQRAPLRTPTAPPYAIEPVVAVPAASTESAWGEEPAAPPATEEDIAAMDWAELKIAIANCTRCGLCQGGRRPVYGSGAQQARWFVAAGASTAADERERQPLAGDAGKLFTNMLAAVDLSREDHVYVSNLIKCRPTTASGGDRAPTVDEAQACRPYLERERVLTGATMTLTLGQIAANTLTGRALQEPLAGARGVVHDAGGGKLVATLHPGELLRRGADKALAWADLCLARAHDGRPGQ